MDVDFWAARINSARHNLSAVQTNRLSNYDSLSNVDNTQGEEDVRAWFPCPFCYVEIEVQMLCNHLQEEHCFDFKNAVMQTADVNGFLCYIIKTCVVSNGNEQ
uniref:Protein DEHYDRATION-INDUCED 19 homolog 6 n=1 Tax=Solanum tuberosum TaxID=4113 RepID=M1BJG5_SOLTU